MIEGPKGAIFRACPKAIEEEPESDYDDLGGLEEEDPFKSLETNLKERIQVWRGRNQRKGEQEVERHLIHE